MMYIIPIYLSHLHRNVTFTCYRYLIQHMGICPEAIVVELDNDSNVKKQIEHKLDIQINYLVEIDFTIRIAVLGKKYVTFPFQCFINLYSPWFEEDARIDVDTVQIENVSETIDVCTYVLDTCDNHHVYNNHLKSYTVTCGERTITCYEILEYLIESYE